jgi:cytochrome oxidase Cu insertion factor (SCO1/SenC/PrrC family)
LSLLRRLAAIFGLICVGICAVCAGEVKEVGPQRGRAAARISWADESGRVRNLSEFAGYPVVLLPMYTRCPSACLQTVAQLKKALVDSAADPAQFRVFLFSIDPTDTPATLVAYRQREAVPLGWVLGAADQSNIDALLESVGFQSAKAGTEFMHPNLLFFLDSKLRVGKWIYGTGYTASDVDSALRIASGQNDWIGQHFDFLYAILVFAAALLCVALVQQLLRQNLRPRQRQHPESA